MSLVVHGFGVGLIDFAFFLICGFFASQNFKPEQFWRWIWFFLFVGLMLLFFLAWLADLGAHL
jgi:Mg2+ and Co2+ transporter CorA